MFCAAVGKEWFTIKVRNDRINNGVYYRYWRKVNGGLVDKAAQALAGQSQG